MADIVVTGRRVTVVTAPRTSGGHHAYFGSGLNWEDYDNSSDPVRPEDEYNEIIEREEDAE